MSTSDILPGGLPDIDTLARLANEFFKAPPGASPSFPNAGSAYGGHGVGSIRDPQTSLPDPHGLVAQERVPHVARGLPHSEAGDGTSTAAFRPSSEHIHGAAHGVDLPFERELQNVLQGLRQPPKPTPAVPASGGSQYYFAEFARFGQGTGAAVDESALRRELAAGHRAAPFDVELVRRDFPILQERVNGRQLVWFDNAATTQKPSCVIDRLAAFYRHENSNIHRAAHELAARATDAYEGARETVRGFLNAKTAQEIVFVRGATEAINLVAQSWGSQHIGAGDEIIVSQLEHHANIVPWHRLAEQKGAKLRVIPVDEDGQILLDEYTKLLSPRTKLVAFTQVSNALGTVTPAKRIAELAHQAGAKVLIDGAQSVSHMRVDVQDLNADFFVFSGHKIFGPTGIGVLYGKEELLNDMPPWQGGGNMIEDVTFERIRYHKAPARFEAGTGNIADAVGLAAALDYVNCLGIDAIGQYEHFLLQYAIRLLKDIPGLRLIGTARDKASVVSFVLDGIKTEDVGAALNKEGIAVRSGHHCAQPILRRFGVESSVRPSLAFYNTCAEVDRLAAVVERIASGGFRY
jgi:cysteine desulfurase/selenocysteine lyase